MQLGLFVVLVLEAIAYFLLEAGRKKREKMIDRLLKPCSMMMPPSLHGLALHPLAYIPDCSGPAAMEG